MLVYVPGAILWLVTELGLGLEPVRVAEPRLWIGLVLGVSGFAFAVWTVRLFRSDGEGTPARWAPPKKLVVSGPYRHVRNPMITSVLVMLAAESLYFGSWHLAAWMVAFFVGNMAYFSRVEEPGLEQRFGDSYRLYRASVPRWIPRLRPWDPP